MLTRIKEEAVNQLAEVLNTIADPIRMRIILSLTRPASADDLQQYLCIGQITLLRHLTTMQDSGLLCSELRGNKLYYSLKDIAIGRAVKLLVAH